MSDRVLIPLPDGRWLALSADVLDAALRAGAEAIAPHAVPGATRGAAAVAVEPLLSAEEAAQQLGVTARWLEDSARAGIIPHHKLGAFRRFRVSEIADHSLVEGAPPTDSKSVTPFRRLSRQ
ncbi:MAG TPA: helix-turn-helix domain-containing protein [Steroidobacteraceae bacterium]|jgi:excisionase family DNA binding protein|nr:helix-turn-helix domain-containing protein [Steroidobacteraceae bacterium]